ncbi:MAG: potassium transporter, partial [Kocuria rhizophila]
RAGRYVLENLGLSQYEANELERIYYRHDRAGLRELAEVWKPGVPLDQNADYIRRSEELRATLENALMDRFADGPAAAPLDDGEHDEAPEHGLGLGTGGPGGRLS